MVIAIGLALIITSLKRLDNNESIPAIMSIVPVSLLINMHLSLPLPFFLHIPFSFSLFQCMHSFNFFWKSIDHTLCWHSLWNMLLNHAWLPGTCISRSMKITLLLELLRFLCTKRRDMVCKIVHQSLAVFTQRRLAKTLGSIPLDTDTNWEC